MDNQNNDRRDYQKEECRDNRAWLIFTGAISLVSVGVAIYCHGQMKKSVKLLNKAADSVAELTVVDVQQGHHRPGNQQCCQSRGGQGRDPCRAYGGR